MNQQRHHWRACNDCRLLGLMQAPRLERQWASSAAALCLELARASPRYKREVFGTELAECSFQPYSVDTTSQNTLGVAPLFSQQWEASIAQPQVAHLGQVQMLLAIM